MYTLTQLGWNNHFQKEWDALSLTDFIPARIITENKTQYKLISETGIFEANLMGKLLYGSEAEDLPKVGDWVAFQAMDDQNGFIFETLPRQNSLARKKAGQEQSAQIIASNIDKAFLVQSLDHNFNIRRLERYLVQVYEFDIQPIIILNKSDLCDDLVEKIMEIEAIAPSVKIYPCSVHDETGMEDIKTEVKEGESIIFLGSSGVGKSSIINYMMGETHFKTSEISDAVNKGKHTTTHRELIVLPEGGILIDNPGTREFGLTDVKKGLEMTFEEIQVLAEGCRFKGCTHQHEPDCKVQEALAEGTLSEDRFQSYLKLQRESANYQMSNYERRKKDKSLGKMYKSIQNGSRKLKNK
ncbi:ribosome small subunit-dependent GTPase A [Sediminitomix flava]|uniref:Small ribosomal subunit biogenesis GTPase RsgA n=1 Tax=Sediminitomix flava TaxID=379075 RepID=A0A315ZIL5_SEDFL|nr:ribosome small subunit-dependent GTPase A [Sediminitomix flava]PWJ44544.1 ribosome biogenesis GTPase [Sediminitomix flava]